MTDCFQFCLNFAFNFNLRRCTMGAGGAASAGAPTPRAFHTMTRVVGRCRFTLSNPSGKRAWFQRLKLSCGEPLSNFAFKFNLRRYSVGDRMLLFGGFTGAEALNDSWWLHLDGDDVGPGAGAGAGAG